MNMKSLRSEIDRLARYVHKGILDEDGFERSKFAAIKTHLEAHLYPAADAIAQTEPRRLVLDDLDRISEAVHWALDVVEGDEDVNEDHFSEVVKMLEGVSTLQSMSRVQQIVNEELILANRRVLKEEPELQPGNVQKLANDSVDIALDSYFEKVADTLGATGEANKEKAPEGEGEQQFSAVDFASDIANLIDRTQTLLDLDGTIARRAFNFVSEKYGPDAAENVKQVLSANFDIEVESSHDAEGDREANRPAAIGAGGGAVAAAAAGGGGAAA